MESLGNVRFRQKNTKALRTSKMTRNQSLLGPSGITVGEHSEDQYSSKANLFKNEPQYIYESKRVNVTELLKRSITNKQKNLKQAPIELDFSKKFRRSTIE